MYVSKRRQIQPKKENGIKRKEKNMFIKTSIDEAHTQKLLEAFGFFPLCKRLGGRVWSGSALALACGL